MPTDLTLFYVWSIDGKKSTTTWSISVDEKPLPILDALHLFTNALRTKNRLLDGTWSWIDAICVSQRNDIDTHWMTTSWAQAPAHGHGDDVDQFVYLGQENGTLHLLVFIHAIYRIVRP
jgi:hypothetical protein